jgi:hypothetical protein
MRKGFGLARLVVAQIPQNKPEMLHERREFWRRREPLMKERAAAILCCM